MFITDTIIDAVQNGKKQFVNTVFANQEKVAEALNQFVDAQSAYTKSALKSSTDVAAKLSSEAVKAAQEVTKFDYTKAYEKFADAFKAKK